MFAVLTRLNVLRKMLMNSITGFDRKPGSTVRRVPGYFGFQINLSWNHPLRFPATMNVNGLLVLHVSGRGDEMT